MYSLGDDSVPQAKSMTIPQISRRHFISRLNLIARVIGINLLGGSSIYNLIVPIHRSPQAYRLKAAMERRVVTIKSRKSSAGAHSNDQVSVGIVYPCGCGG